MHRPSMELKMIHFLRQTNLESLAPTNSGKGLSCLRASVDTWGAPRFVCLYKKGSSPDDQLFPPIDQREDHLDVCRHRGDDCDDRKSKRQRRKVTCQRSQLMSRRTLWRAPSFPPAPTNRNR